MTPRRKGLSQAQDIAERLEDEILRGQRAPGERLDERSLAEYFSVSRTPVREALQRLAASGLVHLRGRQGARVAKLSLSDLLDAFLVIAELEAMAARQASRRITPAQRRRLEACHKACAAEAGAGNHEGFYERNLEFHDTIMEACANRVLQEQYRAVNALTSPYRRRVTYQPGRMAESVPEHAAITAAILAGNGDEACALMRAHVNVLGSGLDDLLHILARSELPAPLSA